MRMSDTKSESHSFGFSKSTSHAHAFAQNSSKTAARTQSPGAVPRRVVPWCPPRDTNVIHGSTRRAEEVSGAGRGGALGFIEVLSSRPGRPARPSSLLNLQTITPRTRDATFCARRTFSLSRAHDVLTASGLPAPARTRSLWMGSDGVMLDVTETVREVQSTGGCHRGPSHPTVLGRCWGRRRGRPGGCHHSGHAHQD